VRPLHGLAADYHSGSPYPQKTAILVALPFPAGGTAVKSVPILLHRPLMMRLLSME